MQQVVGVDSLSNCKGLFTTVFLLVVVLLVTEPTHAAEPNKQFALLQDHIQRVRGSDPALKFSVVEVYVERNLGFEVPSAFLVVLPATLVS